MGSWGIGPGMILEPELEEGEACYYKDDTTTDPDIALSYIGDKVQSILGHLQIDFEGGVSAENLGAKFGEYGSFLPMYQRSPSIWSQPKSPQKVQNPNHSFPEGPAPNYEDGSMHQNGSLPSHQVAEACPKKIELPSNKSVNKTQQRTLKVRIKVGPERMEQYNAEIYNLGLTSPSSSTGTSPLESPHESPDDILQIMTSFPVSGGLLLSPLCEDLLNLTRKIESSLEAACKSSTISVRLLSNEVRRGKKAKSVDKGRSFDKSENESNVDLNNHKQNNVDSEIPECIMQPAHDVKCKRLYNTVKEKNDVLLKTKGSKDSVKEVERVKRASYSPSLKVNLKDTAGEHYRLGTPRESNKSPFGGEKKSKGSQSSGKSTSKLADSSTGDGKKGVQREHNEKPKRLLEMPSGDRPKNANHDTAKAKLTYGDKLKEKSSNRKYLDKVTPETYMTAVNGLEQPMVAPLVIQENWVGCDRCQKWRLLPYGTKAEQLPDKWVCSMLDWLPGMNRCDISEDDTSAAIRASHPGTIPENQFNFQAPADKLVSGVNSTGAHHFDQKLKEKVNRVRMSNPVSSSDGKKDIQRRAVKDGRSKEVNQSIGEVHSTTKFNVQPPHKPTVVEKLKKRKNENVVGDDANPRKKCKKEFERVHGKVEKNKSESGVKRKNHMIDESKDTAFHRDKKSRVTQIEAPKAGNKEFFINRVTEKEHQLRKQMVKSNLTIEDIDKLRKDLGFELLSTAATSTSSKVSDSRESVCSSPVRISQVVRNPVHDFRKNDFRSNPLVGNEGNIIEKCSHNEGMSKEQSNTNSRKKSSLRARDKNRISTQREIDGNDVKSSSDVQHNLNKNFVGSSVEQVSNKVEPWSGKLRIDLRQVDKQGTLCSSKCALVNGGTSKALEARPVNKAEELRAHADLIKNSGFGSESNYEYFKAAIKFLQGASLLEACNGESSKHLEMKPLQIYGTAAKLCQTCAHEYEKSREMALAALAYKCMEVAYMRVVYCKSSSTHRVWHDLQSSIQMAPPGESPSSSASDVDNLNYLTTVDKATLSKGNGSHAGNHVIVPHNVPNFVCLLDFTKDVNLAMEAAKKSRDALATAHVKLEDKKGIILVKRVIDFSFQDVDELICLVWLAFNSINRQERAFK